MLVSEIEYHVVLIPYIEEIPPAMEKHFLQVVPDTIAEFKGSLLTIELADDHFYLHLNGPPDLSPTDIAGTIIAEVSTRIKRVHPELEGYGVLFREDCYIKTGARPSKEQVADFITIAKNRI